MGGRSEGAGVDHEGQASRLRKHDAVDHAECRTRTQRGQR